MKVARLNENAIHLFAGWMETLKQGGSLRAPMSLLTARENAPSPGEGDVRHIAC